MGTDSQQQSLDFATLYSVDFLLLLYLHVSDPSRHAPRRGLGSTFPAGASVQQARWVAADRRAPALIT